MKAWTLLAAPVCGATLALAGDIAVAAQPSDEITAEQLAALADSFATAAAGEDLTVDRPACSVEDEDVVCYGRTAAGVVIGTGTLDEPAPRVWTFTEIGDQASTTTIPPAASAPDAVTIELELLTPSQAAHLESLDLYRLEGDTVTLAFTSIYGVSPDSMVARLRDESAWTIARYLAPHDVALEFEIDGTEYRADLALQQRVAHRDITYEEWLSAATT